MIQTRTMLKVTDNTGARIVQCIKILGGTKRRYAQIGDMIVVSVKKAEPRREIKIHQVARAVVVRQRNNFRRKDGTYIRFDDNAAVIIDAKKEPRGGRIFGPIPIELKEKGFLKIANLAEELV